MHILLVGSGQLGSALESTLTSQRQHTVTVWKRPSVDISSPSTAEQVASLAPDVVINAAAWTQVDAAENNPAAAYAVNALGPKYLAEGCASCSAALVQVSTNEVFAGIPGQFYREYDQRQAESVYARSKLAGETAVTALHSQVYLVRVAWLFGPGGTNFPSKIVAAAARQGNLRVVDDEYGNPTYAPDAAAAIARLIETERYGSYHLVNEGWCSRYQLAQHVLACSGCDSVEVTPIAQHEWQRPSQPPLHAVLVNQAGAALGLALRPWRAAVEEYCRQQFYR